AGECLVIMKRIAVARHVAERDDVAGARYASPLCPRSHLRFAETGSRPSGLDHLLVHDLLLILPDALFLRVRALRAIAAPRVCDRLRRGRRGRRLRPSWPR